MTDIEFAAAEVIGSPFLCDVSPVPSKPNAAGFVVPHP
jgi:hypothetical protein